VRRLVVLLVAALAGVASGQLRPGAWNPRPQAIVDLDTADGLALVRGTWRYADAKVVDVAHRAVGPDLRPSGAPNRTQDVDLQAGAVDFDDASWPVLPPGTLTARRGNGRLSFAWYRLHLTLPEHVGRIPVTGATVVFEVVVDDYAEVWVDGRLAPVLGQTGGTVVQGFNAPNRIVVARDAQPGQRITLAVFGANGPLSQPPGNFVWIRSATLELHRAGDVGGGERVPVTVTRKDPALDAIVPPDAAWERLASGFLFTEGPLWVRDGGYLLFSDPNANTIYRWSPDGHVSVFRAKSGYAGVDVGEYGQPGSNGLALDADGRLAVDEHGRRRVVRIEKTGAVTVLADRYQGKRLNSPNDLVYRSDGALYFTDPPFGLPRFFDDPRKELPYSGVFRIGPDGMLALLTTELAGPNGLAFSPDERVLYVANWDERRKVVMRYEIRPDGSLANGRVFVDATTSDPGEQAWDGLKADRQGNVYLAGPGGIWIVSPEGKELGRIAGPEQPANFAFGDDDGRTLYITARTSVYRMRLGIPGARTRAPVP
jgi:gluconolactonase